MGQERAVPISSKKPLTKPVRFYPDDQERVDQYLKEGLNQIERSPFRPFHLIIGLTGIIVLLGVFSRIIRYFWTTL